MNKVDIEEQFTNYEIARIIGARALQLAMDAPILIKISEKELEAIRYDPLEIAEKELRSGILPISVRRPMPEKRDEKLVKKKVEEKKKDEKKDDKNIEHKEEFEEKEIKEEGEIMELAQPEDEVYEEDTGSEAESE
jgi:DNA-directed RNA polymerase subunit K